MAATTRLFGTPLRERVCRSRDEVGEPRSGVRIAGWQQSRLAEHGEGIHQVIQIPMVTIRVEPDTGSCACGTPGSPDDVTAIFWATNGPELHTLLVSQRGWTTSRYEQFLADSWIRLLLVDSSGEPQLPGQ